MPIYEYLCKECNTRFESLRSMSEADASISCQKCNSLATQRVASACYSKSDGRSSTSGASGCAGCSGGACSSCNH